jgi:hypothetical protein
MTHIEARGARRFNICFINFGRVALSLVFLRAPLRRRSNLNLNDAVTEALRRSRDLRSIS